MLSKFQTWPVAALIGAAGLWRFAALARAARSRARAALALGRGAGGRARRLAGAKPGRVPQSGVPGAVSRSRRSCSPTRLVEADSGVYNLPRWLAERAAPGALRGVGRGVESLLLRRALRLEPRPGRARESAPTARTTGSAAGSRGRSPWLAFGTRARAAPRAWFRARRSRRSRGSLALVAFLPQSHELRYWLFVPLALAIWTARGDRERAAARARARCRRRSSRARPFVLLVHASVRDRRAPARGLRAARRRARSGPSRARTRAASRSASAT